MTLLALMSAVHRERKQRANHWLQSSGLLAAVETAVNAACEDEPRDTNGFMVRHSREGEIFFSFFS